MDPVDRWNWDDLRVFLAAMRATSLRQAAEALEVSHPTARRRLRALETSLGFSLFERRSDGLVATSRAVAMLPAAEEVERAMYAVGRAARAADPELHGPVHLSVPLASARRLLMPTLRAFHEAWPRIEVLVQLSNAMSDLGKREMDVALRFVRCGDSPEEHLVGRRVGAVHRAVYGSGDRWVGWYGGERDRAWIARSPFPELPSHGGLNDPELQAAACAAGMGLAWLPCYIAEPELPRITEPEPEWDVWVLVHPDLRDNPRVRVFREALVAGLLELAPVLEGRSPP